MKSLLRSYSAALLVLLMILPVAFGILILDQSVNNWMGGRGFTPITHAQPIAPASFTPASVTWTLPGEVAKR